MDQETNLEPKMQKSGVGKWLIAALIVVVLAGIATTAFVMLKSQDPMKLYLSAYQKTLQEQTERYEQYYGDVLAHQERLYDEAYQSKTTVTADFELQGDAAQSMPQIAMVKAILSQIQLEMDQQVDPGAKEGSMDVALTLAGQTQASVELYQNETTTAVRAPFLYEKYFALPNDKAGAFMERMGQPEPEVTEIPNFVDMNSLSYGDLKSVLKDSLATAAGLLRKDQFTLENNATYEGETYKKITLQLSEDEAKQMLTAVLEQLKSDQRIQDFFETQMAVNRLSASTEPSFTDYQEMIDQALKNVEKVKFPSGVTIESYVKDGYIAHETMTADIGFEDEAPVRLTTNSGYENMGNDGYQSEVEVKLEGEEKGSFLLTYLEKGKSEDNGLHVDYDIAVTIDDPQSTSGKASLAMATDFKDHASQTTFELLLEGEAFGSELPKMSGFYHTAMDQKSDEEVQQKVDVGIDLDIDDPMLGQQQFHIELHVDKNTAFTDDLSFPGLEADETVHVMETSDAEMQEIGMQIQQNLQGYFGQLLGVFGGM